MSTNPEKEKAGSTNVWNFTNMDGLIKLMIMTVLVVVPFYLEEPVGFLLLLGYLLMWTILLKIKPKTLLLSAASYGIIVLIPYFFGLLISALLYWLTQDPRFGMREGAYPIFVRLLRLLIVWFVTILYFQTTPVQTVIGIADLFLSPLKAIKVPVSDYLKIVMCVMNQLKETGTDALKTMGEKMRASVRGLGIRGKINFKDIAQLIVSLLVDSFDKIEKIEKMVEETHAADLYQYRFHPALKDLVAVATILLFLFLMWLIDKGSFM